MRARTRHIRSTVVDSDDGQSDSDDSEARENGFFDDEALESAESTEDMSGSDQEEIDPFPFTRLPPELRLRVWSFFCPDLLGAPRVLDFNVHDSLSPTRTTPCKVIGAGMCLPEQTRALRCVLATNQQSRSIAKDKFPDELLLESDDGYMFTLCVNLKSDICMLDRVPDFAYPELVLGLSTTNRVNLDGFSQSIAKLALPLHDGNFYEQDADVTSWLRKFRSLQQIFLYTDEDSFGGRILKDDAVRWCASPHACQYYMETFEQEPGYGENYTKLTCWPDAEKSPSFTKAHVPKWHTKFLHQAQEDAFEDAGVTLLPMVIFQTQLSLERFENFVATDYLPLKVFDANEEGSEAESYEEDPDEDFELNGASEAVDTYESDGIDDDEPETFQESGDEHLDDGDSDDGHGYDGDTVTHPFSSPEASENDGVPTVRGRKRHVIADSDDDDDDDHGPSSRPAKRKRVHVIQDSDEEHTIVEAAELQVISSDEDEVPTKRRRVEVVDTDEESDGDSEEDDAQPQRVSLADRLQIRHRRALPEEDSEEEEGEEEEDDAEDDDEEDEDEDGLIDNMAAESDEGDEDEDEEEDE
ncbi:hypothetical protein LLEC1_08058 [Akanthomyces lecanii]|uniref:2EXR domain-containing protein n=1 Tax=Cordyceps confragosa TaxID=2714763 RepID=A0A179I4P7_CORDF|nr:hypothetical protein LLEC1_08058 [Akanthomyces lecanii]